MVSNKTAWAQILYKSGAISPFLKINIFILPSGECEVQIERPANPIFKIYEEGYNRTKVYSIRPPKYNADSIFYIGDESNVLDKIKEFLYNTLPKSADKITVNYERIRVK